MSSPASSTSKQETTLLALPTVDFHSARCHLSGALTNPADKDEKICWDENQTFLSTLSHPDLEDSKGYYSALGCNKTSSHAFVAQAFDKAKAAYKALARTHHPDKAKGNKEMIDQFLVGKDTYELQEKAFQVVGVANCYGDACPNRVNYDRVGEDLRSQFLLGFNKVYQNKLFSTRSNETINERKGAAIYAQKKATSDKKKFTISLCLNVLFSIGERLDSKHFNAMPWCTSASAPDI